MGKLLDVSYSAQGAEKPPGSWFGSVPLLTVCPSLKPSSKSVNTCKRCQANFANKTLIYKVKTYSCTVVPHFGKPNFLHIKNASPCLDFN